MPDGPVRESDLALHCPRYKTPDECLCECQWHIKYMGYDNAMRVIFRADRPRMIKIILDRRKTVRKNLEEAETAVRRCTEIVARLQEELALGSDIWSTSNLLTMKLNELKEKQAVRDAILSKVVEEANALLENFYNVKVNT
jgi:hypothetical protein